MERRSQIQLNSRFFLKKRIACALKELGNDSKFYILPHEMQRQVICINNFFRISLKDTFGKEGSYIIIFRLEFSNGLYFSSKVLQICIRGLPKDVVVYVVFDWIFLIGTVLIILFTQFNSIHIKSKIFHTFIISKTLSRIQNKYL